MELIFAFWWMQRSTEEEGCMPPALAVYPRVAELRELHIYEDVIVRRALDEVARAQRANPELWRELLNLTPNVTGAIAFLALAHYNQLPRTQEEAWIKFIAGAARNNTADATYVASELLTFVLMDLVRGPLPAFPPGSMEDKFVYEMPPTADARWP